MRLSLKVLTFNIWDLPIWIPGSNKRLRFIRLPRELLEYFPDLILLQESYNVKRRKRIVKALGSDYNYGGDYKARSVFPFVELDCSGGLAVISRENIIDYGFYQHERVDGMKFDEYHGNKGYILARIQTEVGGLVIVNAHLYAGRRQVDAKKRLDQLKTMLHHIDKYSGDNPVILGGDLNFSPTIPYPSEADYSFSSCYQEVINHGFKDVFKSFDKATITYSLEENKYTKNWFSDARGSHKFDYILYRSGKFRITALEARVVFSRPEPLSDHYGILAIFDLSN